MIINSNLNAISDILRNINTSGSISIASLFDYTTENEERRFYYNSSLPSDYPDILLNNNYTAFPLVIARRITNVMYVTIIAAHKINGTPKCITGYYNGTFYWENTI